MWRSGSSGCSPCGLAAYCSTGCQQPTKITHRDPPSVFAQPHGAAQPDKMPPGNEMLKMTSRDNFTSNLIYSLFRFKFFTLFFLFASHFFPQSFPASQDAQTSAKTGIRKPNQHPSSTT